MPGPEAPDWVREALRVLARDVEVPAALWPALAETLIWCESQGLGELRSAAGTSPSVE